jgi:hypothetical protein
VTPVTARSPTGMHGLNMAFGTSARCPLRSPQPLLATEAQRSGARLPDFPIEADVSKRPFLPPRRLPFRATAAGSTVLACLFVHPAGFSSNPFALRLPSPKPGFPGPGKLIAEGPLSDSDPTVLIASQAAAPLRDFRPSGS